MKHLRQSKSKKALDRLKVRPAVTIDRTEMDKNIFDLVLKTLYNNADRDGIHIDNEIYAPIKLRMPARETTRLWEVMTGSGLVSPVIGFGNAGKLELTKAGYQLMSQFGGYKEYLASTQAGQQPQTILVPVQMQGEGHGAEETQEAEVLPSPDVSKAAQRSGRRK